VGPRAGLDTEARGKILSPLPGIEPPSPGRSARSQTVYEKRRSISSTDGLYCTYLFIQISFTWSKFKVIFVSDRGGDIYQITHLKQTNIVNSLLSLNLFVVSRNKFEEF
jgi:hypothetical protein